MHKRAQHSALLRRVTIMNAILALVVLVGVFGLYGWLRIATSNSSVSQQSIMNTNTSTVVDTIVSGDYWSYDNNTLSFTRIVDHQWTQLGSVGVPLAGFREGFINAETATLVGIAERTLQQSSQESEHIFVLSAHVLRTGSKTELYWSPEEMHHLGVSANNRFFSWQEGTTLYIYDTVSKSVRTLMTDVRLAVWAPQQAALAVITSTESLYVDVSDDGTATMRTLPISEQLTAIGFVSSERLVGMINSTPLAIAYIDLAPVAVTIQEIGNDLGFGADQMSSLFTAPSHDHLALGASMALDAPQPLMMVQAQQRGTRAEWIDTDLTGWMIDWIDEDHLLHCVHPSRDAACTLTAFDATTATSTIVAERSAFPYRVL